MNLKFGQAELQYFIAKLKLEPKLKNINDFQLMKCESKITGKTVSVGSQVKEVKSFLMIKWMDKIVGTCIFKQRYIPISIWHSFQILQTVRVLMRSQFEDHKIKSQQSSSLIMHTPASNNELFSLISPQLQKPGHTNPIRKNPKPDKQDGFSLTNRVLLEKQIQQQGRIENYYCPAYLRIKIKNFTEINHLDLEASLNFDIHLTLNVRGLPPLIERNVRQMLRLDFNKDDTLQVKQSPEIILKQQQQNGLITYIIQTQVCVGMESNNIFWFPFGLLDLSLSISLQSIHMNGTILKDIVKNSISVKRQCEKQLIKNYIHFVLRRIIVLCDECKQLIFQKSKKQFQYIQAQLKTAQSQNINIYVTKQKYLTLLNIMKSLPIKLQSNNLKELLPVFIDFLTISDKHQSNEPGNIEINENEIDWTNQLNLLKIILMIEKEQQRMSDLQDVFVKFNFMDFKGEQAQKMDYQGEEAKIQFTSAGRFGHYNLSESNLKVHFTSDFVPPTHTQMQVSQKYFDHSILKPFSNSHFRIPIYKFPAATFTTIFVPLVLLGILNLSIYFQDTNLSDRIECLTNVMLAFVALIHVIRKELPFSSHITMIEIGIYSKTGCCLLCFWQSMVVKGNEEYVFDWKRNPFYLINAIIESLVILIPLCLLIKFYLYDKHKYNNNKKWKKIRFNYQLWQNKQCDKAFQVKQEGIQIVSVEQKQQNIKDILMKIIKQSDRLQQKSQQKELDRQNRITLQYQYHQNSSQQIANYLNNRRTMNLAAKAYGQNREGQIKCQEPQKYL